MILLKSMISYTNDTLHLTLIMQMIPFICQYHSLQRLVLSELSLVRLDLIYSSNSVLFFFNYLFLCCFPRFVGIYSSFFYFMHIFFSLCTSCFARFVIMLCTICIICIICATLRILTLLHGCVSRF